jgi:hypothetical protein
MVENGNTLEVLVTIDDSDTYNQPSQEALAALAGATRRADLRRGNFLLFDYGVPVAKTPDF